MRMERLIQNITHIVLHVAVLVAAQNVDLGQHNSAEILSLRRSDPFLIKVCAVGPVKKGSSRPSKPNISAVGSGGERRGALPRRGRRALRTGRLGRKDDLRGWRGSGLCGLGRLRGSCPTTCQGQASVRPRVSKHIRFMMLSPPYQKLEQAALGWFHLVPLQ